MSEKNEVEFPKSSKCPCGSEKKYKNCCFKRGIIFFLKDGEVGRKVPLNEEVIKILEKQREYFVEIFGREPEGDDPVFDEYIWSLDDNYEDVALHMEDIGIQPEIIYAFRKTGLMALDESKLTTKDALEWRQATNEYFRSNRKKQDQKVEEAIRVIKVLNESLFRARMTLGMFIKKCGSVSASNDKKDEDAFLAFFHDFILFCITRSTKTLAAICALIEKFSAEDALALSRVIYEVYLKMVYYFVNFPKINNVYAFTIGINVGTHEFLKKDNGKINHRIVVDKKTGQKFEELPSIKTMASASPFVEDQRLQEELYGFLSMYSHPNVLSINNFINGESFDHHNKDLLIEAYLLTLLNVTIVVETIPIIFELPKIVERDLNFFVKTSKENLISVFPYLRNVGIEDSLMDVVFARIEKIGEMNDNLKIDLEKLIANSKEI